jgi:uncharacterized heparinase superfamily protein
MTRSELALIARTVPHLQPGQVAQRARLRAQRTALRRWPQTGRWLLAGPDPASAVGWPGRFSTIDAGIWRHWPGECGLRAGRIELLGLTRTLAAATSAGQASRDDADWDRRDWEQADQGPPDGDHADRDHADWEQADWEQAGAPQLWRFHLHYWDWAWGLAAEADRAGARALFATVWRSWRGAVTAGRGDAWLPYPAALRAWSFCGLHHDLVAGGEIEKPFIAGLAAHAGFLRRHVESDVGGNHLIKNLKALAGLAVFFADDRLLARVLRRLSGQLTVQVLPDGGHYERAPAYHCQVLADLIDVADLVRATGRTPGPGLVLAIQGMRRWLGGVLSPGSEVPLLNDGFPVGPDLLAAVRPGPPPAGPLLVLPDTGLARATAGGWQLLADVGPPCPDELPAHAHADTFSCLVHVDGVPLLVDTGTSTYVAGVRRGYERSTAAHNTVEVDGADSTEVWGAFRAARRAHVRDVMTGIDGGIVTIEASHDGFRRLPGRPCHRRRWSLAETGLRVDDLVTGHGLHSVVIRWHLAPGSQLRLVNGGAEVTTSAGEFRVTVMATGSAASGPVRLAADTAPLATGFGRVVEAPLLTAAVETALPVRVSTDWTGWVDATDGGAA